VITQGDLVRVSAREQSPPSVKYDGHVGRVTTISPSIYGELFFVQMDGNPAGVDTAFEQQDLEKAQKPNRG
jgi:hypothetical protein